MKKRPIDMADVTHDKPGPETAGQAGDTQGLSNLAEAGSESVQELVEEGQFFEAEVTTHEVPQDDVPPEYRNPDRD